MSIQTGKWTKALMEPEQRIYVYAESVKYGRPKFGETKSVCLVGNRLSSVKPC